jgi:transposase
MIRIDALWLATTPIDMRMGTERLLARVVQVFGAAQAHHGYLFANARGNRMKLLLHDGFGMWCAARRLNQGGFEWPRGGANMATSITLTKQQFDALVLGPPKATPNCSTSASQFNISTYATTACMPPRSLSSSPTN